MSETDEEVFNLLEEEDCLSDGSELASRRSGGTNTQTGKTFKCHFEACSKSYKSMTGYQKHLNRHIFEDLLLNAPGLDGTLEECRRKFSEVLQGIQELPSVGGMSDDIRAIASKVQSAPNESLHIFVDCVAEHLWSCLPQPSELDIEDLDPSVVWGTNNQVLANLDKRRELFNLLKDVVELSTYSDAALEWFLTDFIRGLSSKVECFYICCLKDPHEHLLVGSEESRDDPRCMDFQQSVHYVGGSCVKSVLRKAQSGLGTAHWRDIYDCILNKFLVKEGLPSPGEDIDAWTVSVDRGGLKHINEKVWSFLIALSAILKKEEGRDGSIMHENVYKIVIDDDVMMFLWNNITENTVKEEVDMLLLRTFCKLFTNTWLRGVALRRKNAIARLSRDKAALRSKLST